MPQSRQAAVNDAQEITGPEGLLYTRHRSKLGRHVQEIRRILRRRSHLVTGDDDNRDLRPVTMNEIHRLKTVHCGHENIDDQQIERTGPEQVETLAPVVGYDNIVGLTFEQQPDGRQNRVIIINNKNACHGILSAIRRLINLMSNACPIRDGAQAILCSLQASASGIGESLPAAPRDRACSAVPRQSRLNCCANPGIRGAGVSWSAAKEPVGWRK
jgi:hypothetical protein